MSSQDTFGKVRLKEKVESRVRGDLYARFGGECLETYRGKTRKGAGCLAYGHARGEPVGQLLPGKRTAADGLRGHAQQGA